MTEDDATIESLIQRSSIIDEMREEAARMDDPDRPFFGTAGRLYSANELIAEVEKDTEFGRRLVQEWIRLRDEDKREDVDA